MATKDIFPRGTFPEYRLNCELTNDGRWTCEGIEQEECSSAEEYGVVCRSYKELCNNSFESLPSSNTVPQTTLYAPNNEATTTCSDSNTGIGVLAALLVAVIVGWIVSCAVLIRNKTIGQKQQ